METFFMFQNNYLIMLEQEFLLDLGIKATAPCESKRVQLCY
jgi:hypothetical protein